MAQQQSFPSTVRKQIHSVYTIIQLLVFDNIPPINVWQFFVLLALLQLSNVSSRQDTTVLYFCVVMTDFRNQCTAYIYSC